MLQQAAHTHTHTCSLALMPFESAEKGRAKAHDASKNSPTNGNGSQKKRKKKFFKLLAAISSGMKIIPVIEFSSAAAAAAQHIISIGRAHTYVEHENRSVSTAANTFRMNSISQWRISRIHSVRRERANAIGSLLSY